MECIEKLKKIGIQEINSKTKIATKRLDDIFECRFDEIDRIRVKGFLYILQREYKVDMSEWLEQYDAYHKEQEELNKENEEAEDTRPDNLNISFVDTTMKDKTYTRLVTIFAILLSLFVIYFIYNNVFDDNADNQKIVEEKIDDDTKNDMISPINSDIVDSNATMVTDEIVSSNATIANNESNDITKEQNPDDKSNDTIQDSTDNNASAILKNNTDIFGEEEMTIIPKSPLWVGIIDLQTYKKKQISISESFIIKLDDSKIIRTGHGYFDVKSPQLNKEYIGGDSKYFIYTRENGLKEIPKAEFLQFNRGQEW